MKGPSRKATFCKTALLHVMLAGIIILSTYFILGIKLNNNYNQMKAELLANNSHLQRRFSQLLEDVKLIKNKTEVLYEDRWCSDRWTRFEDKCYFRSTEKKSWSDSRKQCQDHGADLVIINSREEQKFVAELNLNGESWIGLENVRRSKWKWVDGSQLTQAFWVAGQGYGDYATCCTHDQKWKHSYETNRNWICEK